MTEPVRGSFGRLGIGVPYYKSCYEFFRWWTWLIAGGMEAGDHLLNTPELRCEVPIPMAHNGLVREFLKTTADTMVMIEDDHCADQDVIHRMRYKPENQEFDIVCASYVSRRPDQLVAVGFNFVDDAVNEYGEYLCQLEPMKVAESGTQQYDGAALGLVFIRRWVLEAMAGDNPDEFYWFDWRGGNSQDVTFYGRVKELTGARVGVDRDNPIVHVGKTYYTMDQYYEGRRQYIEAREKEKETG